MSPRLRRPVREAAACLAALLALGALAGCTSYSGSKANQVSQWASLYSVVSDDQLVVQDITAIRLSLDEGRLRDVTSNCAGLVFDSGTAYDNLPAPDNTLTDELNVAYVDFTDAGTSCSAVRSLDSRRMKAALRTITTGLLSLDEAERRLAADGVR